MDRGNRKTIVASILLTIPMALLIATQVGGAPPIGKQPKEKPARPGGLLQYLTGESRSSKPAPTQRRRSGGTNMISNFVNALKADDSETPEKYAPRQKHQNHSQHQSQRAHNHNHQAQSQSKRNAAAPQQKAQNWDNVPFHQPQAPKTSRNARTPIRDPGTSNSNLANRRSRTIQATPVSSRQQTSIMERDQETESETSILVQREPRVLPAPVPSATSAPTLIEPTLPEATTANPLSDSSSSRRQNRRKIGAFSVVSNKQPANQVEPKLQEVTKPAKPEAEEGAQSEPNPEQPKIARRPLPEPEPQPSAANTAATENKTAQTKTIENKTAENKTAQPKSANTAQTNTAPADTAQPTTEPKLVAEPAAPKPMPQSVTAVESIKKQPVPSAEVAMTKPAPTESAAPAQPLSTADSAAPAASTLSPPAPLPTPEQTVPAPAQPAPVPMAGVPSRKFALVPSEPAAHRAGPPTSAFEPRQRIVTEPSTRVINPASTPIGSGVASSTQNGAFRKPDFRQQPSAQPYGVPTYPTQNYPAIDPYAAHGFTPIQPPTVASPAATNPTIPMHPITDRVATAPTEQPYRERSYPTTPLRPAPAEETRTLRAGETAVASELPGIRVVTHGPSSIMIRQTHQFEIRVENRGSIDAEGVMVRAVIPDWAEVRGQTASRGDIEPQITGTNERLVWTIDQLPAGATERMFVRLKAERSGTHGLDVDWTLVPKKSVAKIHVHKPELELAIEGPNEVVYGESQTYKVRVLNPGDGIAPNVVFTLSPNSATPQTQRIGDIPSGKEAQFEVELTAQDLGDLKIHGLASGDLELRAEATKTIRVAAAKLEAVLTGPELKYQDTEAEYHLQLQNSGVAASQQIVATLRLPAGAKYLGGLDNATQRGNVLTWQLDALTPGAVRDYQFRCKMSSPGDQMFMFDCKGTAAGVADVAITTRVESISDLVLTINDPAAPAPVGGEVVYEIVIRNRGSKEAKDVRAIAQFSHGIEPRRVEGHTGELLTGQVLFDNIERIGPGEEVRLKVIAEAERAGHHRFRSEVRSGDTVLVAEEATHYMSPRSERVSRRSGEIKTR